MEPLEISLLDRCANANLSGPFSGLNGIDANHTSPGTSNATAGRKCAYEIGSHSGLLAGLERPGTGAVEAHGAHKTSPASPASAGAAPVRHGRNRRPDSQSGDRRATEEGQRPAVRIAHGAGRNACQRRSRNRRAGTLLLRQFAAREIPVVSRAPGISAP